MFDKEKETSMIIVSHMLFQICTEINLKFSLQDGAYFGPSVVRMNRTVFGKICFNSNWHNAKFIFKHLETNSMKYKYFEGENVQFFQY